MNLNKSEAGTAILEFALVIPFLAIILFGLVDVMSVIQKKQYLAVTARELGNLSYRKCKDAVSGDSTDSCLKESVDEVLGFINGSKVINNTEVLVQAWEVNSFGGFPVAPAKKGEYKVGKALSTVFYPGTVMNLKSYDAELRPTLITVELLHDTQLSPTVSFLSFFRQLKEIMVF